MNDLPLFRRAAVLVTSALWLFSVAPRAGAQPCNLSITLTNHGTDIVGAEPAWWNFDYSAADNKSFLTNYVGVNTAGIPLGSYLAWCIDVPDDIAGNPGSYTATFYSSCDVNLDTELPAHYPSSVYVTPATWHIINYILNHKNGAYFYDVQVAIWTFVGGPITLFPPYTEGQSQGYPNINQPEVDALLADANANAAGWQLECGDVIAVVVGIDKVGPHDQLTIIEVPYPCVPCLGVTKTIACFDGSGNCGSFGKSAGGFIGTGCTDSASQAPAFCYDITITNCGDITLSNLTVVDDQLPNISGYFFAGPTTLLPPGASITRQFTMAFADSTVNHVSVQGDAFLAQSITNVGGTVVTNGQPVSAGDSASAVVDTASVSCDVSLYSASDLDGSSIDNHVLLPSGVSPSPVTFNITVKNTGNSDLTGITLSGLSSLGCTMPPPFELAAGLSTNIQLCVQNVGCSGENFTISVTGQVGPTANHCAVLTSSGAPIYACSSCLGQVEYTVGVAGTVFLHCNPANCDFTGDLGLGSVPVTLSSNNVVVASILTDGSGDYAFSNLMAGTYVVQVAPGAPYVQVCASGNTGGMITVTLTPCGVSGVDFAYADTNAPVISVKPGVNYGCNPAVIISDTDERTNVSVISSSCGPATFLVTHVDSTNLCDAMEVFTITASDSYGNSVTDYVTNIWTLAGPPVIKTHDIPLGCNPDLSIYTDAYISNLVSVTSGCSTVSYSVTHTPDNTSACAGSRTFTITATDLCGNSAIGSVMVSWTLADKPVITPQNVTLGCNPQNLSTYTDTYVSNNLVTVTSGCSTASFTVTHGADSTSACAGSRTFTITATDLCGNSAIGSVMVSWTLADKPVITPQNVTLGCNPQNLSTYTDTYVSNNLVTVTSGCSTASFTVTHGADSTSACAGSRTFTIVATDLCGNSATGTVMVSWTLADKPVITPQNVTLGCNPQNLSTYTDTYVSNNLVTVTSGCSTASFTVTHGADSTSACAGSRTFTIVATDLCGNSATGTVMVSWTLADKPVITPQNVTLGCNPQNLSTYSDTYVSNNLVTVTSGCSTASFTVTHGADSTSACAGSRTFTIVATDLCGNSATGTVMVSWTLADKPVITPQNVTLGCNPQNLSTYTDTYVSNNLVTVTSGCSTASFTVTHGADSTSACAGSRTFTIIATDLCGNSATGTVMVSWTLADKPVITAHNITLGCNPQNLATFTDSYIHGVVTVTSGCSTASFTVTHTADSTSACAGSRTFTIIAKDLCGNSATQSLMVSWTLASNPVITASDISLGCNPQNLATYTDSYIHGLVTVTSACSTPSWTVTHTPDSVSTCSAKRVFTIVATDLCGNSSTGYVTVSWTLDAPPVITCPPDTNLTITAGLPAGCIFGATQGGWGAPPNGNNVAMLLSKNFSKVYPGGFVEIGIPTGKYAKFTSAVAIQNFLPAGSTPGVLTMNYVNPTSTSAGVFAGQVLALQLNVNFGDAGYTLSPATPIGNLVYTAPGSPFTGMTVRQILAEANVALGGGTVSGITISAFNDLINNLNCAFDGCSVTSWAAANISSTAGGSSISIDPSQTGTATASDTCSGLTGPPGYSDVTNSVGTCPGSAIIIRTWSVTNNCGNIASCEQTINLGCPCQTPCLVTNVSNFNGTPVPAKDYIWFNANFTASGIPSTGATIYFDNSTIKFTANSTAYNLAVPNAVIVFSPSATCISGTFETVSNTWLITSPIAGSDEIFLSGFAFPVPANFPGGINPVNWVGSFQAPAGVTINWKWGAAVYTQFTTTYNSLGVKFAHTDTCSVNNSDHAGSPENYLKYVTGGCRGGGGSEVTGSWSGTQGVTPCSATPPQCQNNPPPTPCDVLGACTPPYPFTTGTFANSLTGIAFNESSVLVTNLVTVDSQCTPTQVKVYYSDERALTLGVRRVVTKPKTGPSVTNNYTITALGSDPGSAINPAVGATIAQGGVDVSGRPMFPAMFVTDITGGPANPDAGDWQYGGLAQPPTAVFGAWKGAVVTIDQTHTPTLTTVTPDADPAANGWSLGAGSDPVPAGLANGGFGAEVRWDISSLSDNFGFPLKSGHTYHLYFMVHDGDQNKVGGDCGQACGTILVP